MPDRTDWLTGRARGEAATERILAAAADLLTERGFDAVTVDAVAHRAGCSRATLYRHVGGRQAIVDGVLARAAADVARRVSEAVAGRSGTDRITEAILASVIAIRGSAPLHNWVTGDRSREVDDHLAGSPRLGEIAAALTGLSPTGEAAAWTVRVVLTLLTWPLPDPESERRLVRRFVAPGFG
ncbi:helix-turn-helix domain-containing protein [Rhodococcus olei]|uniref:TetR/AcrR family transcriptional regulator n=1 Tax=Rhodococcus olei TaxID=2161675 RepID=UPI0031EF7361